MLVTTGCAALRRVDHRFHRSTVTMKRGLVIHSSLTPTLSGCPTFAPAYVGQPRRGEAHQSSVIFSFRHHQDRVQYFFSESLMSSSTPRLSTGNPGSAAEGPALASKPKRTRGPKTRRNNFFNLRGQAHAVRKARTAQAHHSPLLSRQNLQSPTFKQADSSNSESPPLTAC